MTNVEMLQSAITASGLKKNFIARKLGLSLYGFRLKETGEKEFVASEIKELSDMLHLDDSSTKAIFLQ